MHRADILLHRGMVAIETLLPGFRGALLARDAVPFDTGSTPWLGEYGWLATGLHGWEIVSATRPLVDAVTRKLIRAVPGVTVHPETRVTDLRVGTEGVGGSAQPTVSATAALTMMSAEVVVDASGRGSRLDRWLPELANRGVDEVDARVGYAGRLYQQGGPLPVRSGGLVSRLHRGRRLRTRPAGGGRTVDDLRDGARRRTSAQGYRRLRALPRRAARPGHHRPGLPRAGDPTSRSNPADRQPTPRLGPPRRLAGRAARRR